MYFTKFEEIYKLFLGSIQDYHLRDLFATDPEVADDMLETYLTKAVVNFRNCTKNIYDLDMVNKAFRCELDIEEKKIVCDYMLIEWLNFVINNITQMNATLNDTDFTHYSEEKNLKEKSNYAERLREIASNELVQYGLYHTPFKQWAVGNYGL